MTVQQNSWHAKAFRWMVKESADPQTTEPSVCWYWTTIFIGIPVVGLLCCAFAPVIIPVAWISDKLEKRFKGKSICPFGKVEFK